MFWCEQMHLTGFQSCDFVLLLAFVLIYSYVITSTAGKKKKHLKSQQEMLCFIQQLFLLVIVHVFILSCSCSVCCDSSFSSAAPAAVLQAFLCTTGACVVQDTCSVSLSPSQCDLVRLFDIWQQFTIFEAFIFIDAFLFLSLALQHSKTQLCPDVALPTFQCLFMAQKLRLAQKFVIFETNSECVC